MKRILLLCCLLLPLSAAATDTWTNVRPGIDWLHRTTGGSAPQDIQAVRIDLGSGSIGLRASMDAPGTERGVGTNVFANSVGAVVAINGDWSNGNTPVGLAIGNGFVWRDHYSNPNIGATWGTFGCDVWNGCTIEALPPLPDIWWYQPTLPPYRYYNAIGANGLLLLDDGVPLTGCFDGCAGDSCRNPRSGVCLEQDGEHLWFFVADGRRPGAAGMTCGEMRTLALDLGCWDAAMLDGGGSSTLWVDGAIRNQPSDGSPRTVANHVGVIYTPTPDAECPFAGGAYCTGSVLTTCTGGKKVNQGDCGFFGTTCEEQGDWAYCVNPQCPDGDGQGAACLDASRVGSCTDGVYSEGDCGVFGLACGSDAGGTSCMDPRCAEGPNTAFCLDASTRASCSEGTYAESPCGADETCEAGVCAAPGDDDDATEPPGDDDDSTEPVSDDDDLTPPSAGAPGRPGSEVDGGCSVGGGAVGWVWLLGVVGVLGRRRGRSVP